MVASPVTDWISVYSSLAILFTLVAFRVLLVWCDQDVDATERSPWLLVGVGVACGLSFGAKPNIGLLTLAAAVVGIWVIRRKGLDGRSLVRQEGLVAGGFVIPLVLVALPIVLSGAWNDFVSQVFADKGDYIRVGTSYATTVSNSLDALRTIVANGGQPLDALHAILALLPIFLTITIVWGGATYAGAPDRRPRGVLRVVHRRRARGHVPAPGIESSRRCSAPRLRRHARGGERLPGRPAHCLLHVRHAAVPAREHHGARGNGHDRAALGRRVHQSSRDPFGLSALPERPGGEAAPVVESRSSGLSSPGQPMVACSSPPRTPGSGTSPTPTRDPLPYDIPEVSDLGAGGEQGVIRRLERSEADLGVCATGRSGCEPAGWNRGEIEHWVRTRWKFVESLSHCDMFRKPG